MIITIEPLFVCITDGDEVYVCERSELANLADFNNTNFNQLSYEPNHENGPLYHIIENDLSTVLQLASPTDDPRMEWVHTHTTEIKTFLKAIHDAEHEALLEGKSEFIPL